jgi:hypothetical protein
VIHQAFAFEGVALSVWRIAWVTLAIIVVSLLATSFYCFCRTAGELEDEVRRATMDLSPDARRRFFAVYAALRPRNAAIAWILAVVFGPIGENFYGRRWPAFFAAVFTLNGLGAWSLVSWFAAPQIVMTRNRDLIARALLIARDR